MLLTDSIAETAWLISQYEHVRAQAARLGKFLTRKEFLAKPGYAIAVAPLAMLAMLKAEIPFASIAINHAAQPPLHQNGAPLIMKVAGL